MFGMPEMLVDKGLTAKTMIIFKRLNLKFSYINETNMIINRCTKKVWKNDKVL